MKLDSNINQDGRGKYALLKLRKQAKPISIEATTAATTLKEAGLLLFGNEGPGEQFFVMKVKDQFAGPALRAYAKAVRDYVNNLLKYAEEVEAIAIEAEELHAAGKSKLPD